MSKSTQVKLKNNQITTTVINDDDEETRCGFGSWKPEFLQRFATPWWYMAFSNILGILQGAFFMYFVATMSTIEKRFGFSSKVTGLIVIADNISPIFTSSITGYYASHVHRPRMIALGMFIVSIACFMNVLPYILYGPGTHLLYSDSGMNQTSLNSFEFCDGSIDRNAQCQSPTTQSSKSYTIPAVIIFFLSNFLNGVGNNAFYTAGFTYLDDNVKKQQS